MEVHMGQRGQAAVLVAILALVVGIVAFAVIYGMNSRQNAELASTVAESITISEPVIEDAYMETLGHAARRHGPITVLRKALVQPLDQSSTDEMTTLGGGEGR